MNALAACHTARAAWERTQPQLFLDFTTLTDAQPAPRGAAPPTGLGISEGRVPVAAPDGCGGKQQSALTAAAATAHNGTGGVPTRPS